MLCAVNCTLATGQWSMEMRYRQLKLSACLDNENRWQSLFSNFDVNHVGQLRSWQLCVLALSLIDDWFVIFILFFYVKAKNRGEKWIVSNICSTVGRSDSGQIDSMLMSHLIIVRTLILAGFHYYFFSVWTHWQCCHSLVAIKVATIFTLCS
jgi:hypothetical protein